MCCQASQIPMRNLQDNKIISKITKSKLYMQNVTLWSSLIACLIKVPNSGLQKSLLTNLLKS